MQRVTKVFKMYYIWSSDLRRQISLRPSVKLIPLKTKFQKKKFLNYFVFLWFPQKNK